MDSLAHVTVVAGGDRVAPRALGTERADSIVSFSSRYFNRFDLSDKDSFFDSKTRSTIVSIAERCAHSPAGWLWGNR